MKTRGKGCPGSSAKNRRRRRQFEQAEGVRETGRFLLFGTVWHRVTVWHRLFYIRPTALALLCFIQSPYPIVSSKKTVPTVPVDSNHYWTMVWMMQRRCQDGGRDGANGARDLQCHRKTAVLGSLPSVLLRRAGLTCHKSFVFNAHFSTSQNLSYVNSCGENPPTPLNAKDLFRFIGVLGALLFFKKRRCQRCRDSF